MTFSVLFVCTGNVCRSPAAERLMQARLRRGLPISVSSAGTGALVGRAIDAPSALALRELGAISDGHAGRQLERHMITADLVLTAETQHRDSIVRHEPMSFRRAFTMREFARLSAGFGALSADPTAAALRERVAQVAAQRGRVDPPGPGADEVGDPFGAGVDEARKCVLQISAAIDSILVGLGVSRPVEG